MWTKNGLHVALRALEAVWGRGGEGVLESSACSSNEVGVIF